MIKRVFHCSPVEIKKFEIPFNGLHFGTRESALQAVRYKLNNEEDSEVFLHEILLDVSNVEDVFDQGMDWREYLGGDIGKVYSYTNKYEPSTDKSYVVFSTKFIKDVVSVSDVVIKGE